MGRSTPAGHRTASRYAPTHPSPSPTRRRADAPRRAQQTYATYLQRWTAWCTGCGLARRALRRGGQHLPIGAGGNLIDVNPCARIPRPTVLRELQRREVLTGLEYAAFLTAARALGPTHHAIAVLGGMLGLRASEMAGLTVESLSTVRGHVTLTFVGKGDKPARMPVPLPALRRCRRPSTAAPADRCCAPAPAPAPAWPPLGAPLRRPHRAGRRDQPAHRAARAPAHRRHGRAQPGHSAARHPAPAAPRPPGDHPGQLRHQPRRPRATRLPPGRRLPRPLGQLIWAGQQHKPSCRRSGALTTLSPQGGLGDISTARRTEFRPCPAYFAIC